MSAIGTLLSCLGLARRRAPEAQTAAVCHAPQPGPDVPRPSVVDGPRRPVDLVSDDYATFRQTADTSCFIDWHYAHVREATGISWLQLWGRYHEFCMLHQCRPLTERKLQQQLRPLGVVTRRVRAGESRPTVYDLPARNIGRRVA